MSLSAGERAVVEAIAQQRKKLVALAADLIRFDTTTFEPGNQARDEAALQRYLANRLRTAGAEIDLWEPKSADPTSRGPVMGTARLIPPGLDFTGRPQLVARFRGAGGGRSLLLNGHVDVVSAEPRERWSTDPNQPVVRDGKLYGRGACDMKGGVAAMVFAAETLAAVHPRLAGDLLICTVTDEETTGAGGAAAVAHGVHADAGIVPEPSGLDIWVACRGSLIPTITVQGRAGHAGFRQRHWTEGGAVNAIDHMMVVMDAMRRLQDEWNHRPDHQHPYLSPGDIVPVLVQGGEWNVSYPASCRVTYHVAYLPGHADPAGWGSAVEQEIVDCVAQAAALDPWLVEHPPIIDWAPDVPSAEISLNEPIVSITQTASADIGHPTRITGMDNWHDGATFTRFGGTPTLCYGPGTNMLAHTVDEYVPVDDLVACAQGIALAALRFCDRPLP